MRKAASAKPFRPPDAAELERFLDYLAGLMARHPKQRHHALFIWRIFETKLNEAREAEAIYAAAAARFRRLQDRTEARSS